MCNYTRKYAQEHTTTTSIYWQPVKAGQPLPMILTAIEKTILWCCIVTNMIHNGY